MKLSELFEAKRECSKTASAIVRNLCYAGIAVIWVFRADTGAGSTLPRGLLLPGILIVIALTLDLAQYVSSAILFGWYGRREERKGTSLGDEMRIPTWLNRPNELTFYGKIGSVAAAHIALAVHLFGRFV